MAIERGEATVDEGHAKVKVNLPQTGTKSDVVDEKSGKSPRDSARKKSKKGGDDGGDASCASKVATRAKSMDKLAPLMPKSTA